MIDKVKRIVDTLKPKGSHMSDPILSPDGKMMWNGLDWVPLPTQSVTTVQDSVVMGGYYYPNRTFCSQYLFSRYRKTGKKSSSHSS